jgi:hypothetical protein
MPLRFSSRFSFLLHFIGGGGVLGASSGAHRKSRLFLRLGEEMLLGEFYSAFTTFVRFVWHFSCAVGRDHLPRPGGSFCAVVAESLSLLRKAAPNRCFPCLRRSNSDNDSSALWWARGVDSCGDSKVWSCSLVVVGGLLFRASMFIVSLTKFGAAAADGFLEKTARIRSWCFGARA